MDEQQTMLIIRVHFFTHQLSFKFIIKINSSYNSTLHLNTAFPLSMNFHFVESEFPHNIMVVKAVVLLKPFFHFYFAIPSVNVHFKTEQDRIISSCSTSKQNTIHEHMQKLLSFWVHSENNMVF